MTRILICLALLLPGLTPPVNAQPIDSTDLASVTTSEPWLRRVLGSVGQGASGVPVAGGYDMDGDDFNDYAIAAMEASIDLERASVRRQAGFDVKASSGFFYVPWPGPEAAAAGTASFDCDPIPESQLDAYIQKIAQREGFTPDLLRAVISKESAFHPCAVSTKGAQGLMQLMPGTAAELGVADPFDVRPILLTWLTTFLGLLPLLLETSTQAQFLIPMAVSLGFGILFGTFLSLLLVPASYLILEDIIGFFKKFVRSTDLRQ